MSVLINTVVYRLTAHISPVLKHIFMPSSKLSKSVFLLQNTGDLHTNIFIIQCVDTVLP